MPYPATSADALALLCEWVDSPPLRRHCRAVAASMAAYAQRFGEDPEPWVITGLLHDADYERYPDTDDEVNGHPRAIVRHLGEHGADRAIIDAIAGHASFLGVARETTMAKALFAVDELSGFVMACAAVRPDGIHGLKPKSVRKKLRMSAFASAVDRDDIELGADELGVELDEHIATVIAALDAHADELELHGQAGAPAR